MSICYAAPGHALRSTAGTARNVLSLANALSRWADVTVAFRSVRESFHSDNFKVIAIESESETPSGRKDDVAVAGLNVFSHVRYLRKLRRFSKDEANSFDLVLEKGWRLSGFLSSAFCAQGVPSVLVENLVHQWTESLRNIRGLAKYTGHTAAEAFCGFYSRQIPLVIAETDELKNMLVAHRGLTPERVEVVGLGVDHVLFRPLNQASCRIGLGIPTTVLVLLYVGGMDGYHDLGPLIDALARVSAPFLELHIVGDGEYRGAYEERAKSARVPIRFHGQVPHDRVPVFIGAADLCLAPYRIGAFPSQSVSFSTLKIPEYMACGRAVVSIPSGHISKLIKDQVDGFLFANDVVSWVRFLEMVPSREKLIQMGGTAARAAAPVTWEKTAARYLEVCQKLTARQLLQVNPGAEIKSSKF